MRDKFDLQLFCSMMSERQIDKKVGIVMSKNQDITVILKIPVSKKGQKKGVHSQ